MGDADDLHLLQRDCLSLALGHARVDHRQLDVLERAGPREKVVRLEDEAETPAADVGALVRRQVRGVPIFEAVDARGRLV